MSNIRNNNIKFISVISRLFISACCIVFLNGCVSGMAGWKGHIVKKENRIKIDKVSGKAGGVWETGDLSIKYEYVVKGDRIELEGKIFLADKITHFSTLDYLSVMVQFLDGEGGVAGHETLYTSSKSWFPVIRLSFSRSFVLPSKTDSISFSYSGKVSDGNGDDGIDWSFWFNP
ncbi:MAG: hypothetical protein EHM30_08385 [Desulfobacteraceae bacterium]|nr:MAG: hypothetical protein EHM30_08385 [Desulfobacteraceae bacterium]